MSEGLRYLRLSVTARCRMRCLYCRPAGGPVLLQDRQLTPDQIGLLVSCAAREGVRKVRITGGEPLERADLEEVVAAVARVPSIEETALTTSGLGLAGRCARLRDAGLDRVNVSLDTLRPDRYQAITKLAAHEDVLSGIREAVRVFRQVKLNAVLLAGLNDDEAVDLVRFGADLGARVRFIERYGVPGDDGGPAGVPSDVVVDRLRRELGAVRRAGPDPMGVEEVYEVGALAGATVGVVRSASAPPCAQCTRLRVTPGGRLLSCLFAQPGPSVAELLARGDAEGVRAAIRAAYSAKRRTGPRGRTVLSVCELGG